MAFSTNQIIAGVVAFIIAGSTLGIGLVAMSTISSQVVLWNGVNYTVSEVVPAGVLALIPLIPTLFVIGLAVAFIPRMGD